MKQQKEEKTFEEDVYTLLEKNVFDWEALRNRKAPEYSRVFSPLLWNVLNWLPFEKEDVLVEIGGGYGEFSVRLADIVSKVHVLEPDEAKAGIVRMRCRGIENVFVSSESFDVFEADLPDNVTGIILHDGSAFENVEVLERALKKLYTRYPDSLTVILCDNARGIRYQCAGLKEKSGIVNGRLQLQREELQRLVDAIGYSDSVWYYPYPEATFALSVFSDGFLPRDGQIVKYNLKNLETGFKRDSEKEFAETNRAVALGKFSSAVNSFLVLAGRLPKTVLPLFVKFSNQRADFYSIRTEIYNDGEVRKIALEKSGRRHIHNMQFFCEAESRQYRNSLLEIPGSSADDQTFYYSFISGTSLIRQMEEAINSGEDGFCELLIQWRDNVLKAHDNSFFSMTNEFRKVFGSENFPQSSRSGTVNNIDLVFDNIIIVDGKWMVIDNEWSFDFPIPVEYILFRGLFYFLNSRDVSLSNELEKRCWSLLGIDENLYNSFYRMEKRFQQYLLGRNTKCL